jgi:HAD superfamily hydrolase (TIGR01490 family)
VRRFAFFDFDGTITRTDTLLSFIRFTHGKAGFALGFALNLPWLLAMRLGMISNQAAKQRILTHFYRKRPLDSFNRLCTEFSSRVLPDLVRPKALAELQQLQTAGFTVVIVSASPENWIRDWAASVGAECIATRLQTVPDKHGVLRLTGRIDGRNCHGEEKPLRIKEKYSLAAGDEIYTYGDSRGDLPLLRLGTVRFYKPFR